MGKIQRGKKSTTKRKSMRRSVHLNLSENVDLDFEKAESDMFSNEEELAEILERQEEVIIQAKSLCVPFDKRVMLGIFDVIVKISQLT
jgi:hypothetical protein